MVAITQKAKKHKVADLACKELLEGVHGELVGILKSAIVLKLFLHSIIGEVGRPALQKRISCRPWKGPLLVNIHRLAGLLAPGTTRLLMPLQSSGSCADEGYLGHAGVPTAVTHAAHTPIMCTLLAALEGAGHACSGYYEGAGIWYLSSRLVRSKAVLLVLM